MVDTTTDPLQKKPLPTQTPSSMDEYNNNINSNNTTTKSRKKKKKTYIILASLATLFFCGCLIGAAIGASKINRQLVDQGVDMLDAARAFATSVFDDIRFPLTAATSIQESLYTIQQVVDTEVDIGSIIDNLQCLMGWVDSIPDPILFHGEIAQGLALVGELKPAVETLYEYASLIVDKTSDGAIKAELNRLLNTEGMIQVLLNQSDVYVSAAAQLPATNGASYLGPVIAAFRDLFSNPSWNLKEYALTDIIMALDAMDVILNGPQEDDNGGNDNVWGPALGPGPDLAPSAAVIVSASSSSSTASSTDFFTPTTAIDVPSNSTLKYILMETTAFVIEDFLPLLRNLIETLLAGTLPEKVDAVLGAYSVARPCLNSLLSQASRINDQVMQLPADIKSQLDSLQGVHDILESMLNDQGILHGLNELFPDAFDENSGHIQIVELLHGALNLIAQGEEVADGIFSNFELLDQIGDIRDQVVPLRDSVRNAHGSVTLLNLMYTSVCTSVPSSYPDCYSYTMQFVDELDGLNGDGSSDGSSAGSGGIVDMADTIYQQISAVAVYIDLLPGITDTIGQISNAFHLLPSQEDVSEILGSLSEAYSLLPNPASQAILLAQTSLRALVDDVTSLVGDAIATLEGITRDGTEQLEDISNEVMGNINQAQADYEPTFRQIDIYRQAALYSMFFVTAAMALLIVIGVWRVWPFGVKLGLVVMLVLIILSTLLCAATTVGLSAGTDGCDHIENIAVNEFLQDSPAGQSIAKYYFYNQGGNLTAILKTSFDIDTQDVLDLIQVARTDIQTQLEGQFSLGPLLLQHVQSAVDTSYLIDAGIQQLLATLSHENVFPVYIDIKSYPCCTVLDMGGGVWVGMVVLNVCGIALAVLAMFIIRFMANNLDTRSKGCGMWHSWNAMISDSNENGVYGGGGGGGGLIGTTVIEGEGEGEGGEGEGTKKRAVRWVEWFWCVSPPFFSGACGRVEGVWGLCFLSVFVGCAARVRAMAQGVRVGRVRVCVYVGNLLVVVPSRLVSSCARGPPGRCVCVVALQKQHGSSLEK
jgi:hypothetical protein